MGHPDELGRARLGLAFPPSVTLDRLEVGSQGRVLDVHAPAHAPEWRGWLHEIGFVQGEPVQLVARAAFGGDPLVVRIGASTFALRRAEAACIAVVAHEDDPR